MAKYGLGQIDFNLLVQLSLNGLIEEPDRHLSTLLRSGQPIERETRTALADALDGRSATTRLKITVTKKHEFVRRFRKLREKIELGRRVKSMMPAMDYNEAVKQVAESSHYGEKSIQGCVTLAKRLENWVQKCRSGGSMHSDGALEMAFVYATIKGTEYEKALRPSVEMLTQLVESFEQVVLDSQGTVVDFRR